MIGAPVRIARSITLQIFSALRLGQRAAEHREVLREHEDGPAVDAAMPGHHTVAQDCWIGHAEVGGAMRHEPVELDERSRIEQRVEPLARGQLACLSCWAWMRSRPPPCSDSARLRCRSSSFSRILIVHRI